VLENVTMLEGFVWGFNGAGVNKVWSGRMQPYWAIIPPLSAGEGPNDGGVQKC